MGTYHDRQGKPISMARWARLFGDEAYKRVGSDVVGELHVSTVWLGLDHGLGGSREIQIFETMVFGLDGDEEICVRYATEAEAKIGHYKMVLRMANHPLGKWPSEEDVAAAIKSAEAILRDLTAQ